MVSSGSSRSRSVQPVRLAAMLERLESRYLFAAGTGLKADYFDNADLTGWKLARTDATVDFNWGTASPDAQLSADTFSIRWSGQFQARFSETYTFYTTSDDGVRLWVNGQRIINDWNNHGSTTNTASIALVTGRRYDITLEYYDNISSASVKLEWSSPSQARQVIPAEYLFPAKTGGLLREVWTGVSGSALSNLTSNAAYPNSPNTVTTYAPAESPSNWADTYGERLRGFVTAPVTGNYIFYIASDDNSALYLSNSTDPAGARQIASVSGYTSSREWTKYPSQTSVTIPLVANQSYYIEALHKEGSASDNLAIGWKLPGNSTIEVIPSYHLSPLLPTVRMYQIADLMVEGSSSPARIQVVREGTSTAAPLTVQYITSGSATSGVDYATPSGTLTIPAGAASAEITLTPLQDTTVEQTELVTLNLVDSPEYLLSSISSQQASATIQDDDYAMPAVGVSAISATPLTAMTTSGSGLTKTIVTITGQEFTQAVQLATTGTYANPWDATGKLRNTIALKTGDAMVLEFYARRTSATGRFGAVFQLASSPYTTPFSTPTITANAEWTKYQYTFSLPSDYAVNAAHVQFNVGYGAQTVQFAGIKLLDYGQAASLLPADTLTDWGGFNNAYGSMATVAATGPGFTQALEVETTTKPANTWELQALRPIQLAVAANEAIYLEFYARSATASNATIAAFLQREGSPYTKSGYTQQNVGSTWTLIRIPFASAEAYAVEGADLGFFFGFGVQKVQIGGIRMVKVWGARQAIADDPLAAFSTPSATYGTKSTVAVTGQTFFTQALQIDTTSVPATPDLFAVTQPSTLAMKAGDTVYVDLYARSNGAGNARFNLVVRSTATPAVNSYSALQTIGTAWTPIRVAFALAADYAAGAATLALECGYGPQSLQVAFVHLTDIHQAIALDGFPTMAQPQTYGGRDPASAWRTTAQTSIEANRKAPLTVNVIDQFGQPVDGVNVIIRQKKHGYLFGTAADAGLLARSTGTAADTYRSIIQRDFNVVVLENALKWPNWVSNRQLAIDASNWVVNHDIVLRGHTLVWPSRRNMPTSIWSTYDTMAATDPTAAAAWLRQAVLDHINDEANAVEGLPMFWDVVNEPYANHDVMDILGNAVMIDWFNAARAADPAAELYLNDYGIFHNRGDANHLNNFEYWLNYLITNGAAIDAFGEQSHYGGSSLPDLDQLQPVINRFTKFGLPFQITEFDVNTKNEQVQADFLRDYFTFIFGQPQSTAILQWGFWANAHWLPEAALWRSDFSIKPNGQQYEDLIFNEWWSDLRGTTLNGAFSARVFKGEYEIVVQKNDTKTVQTVVADAGGNITVTLDVTAPTVTSWSVNSGQAQRSMVTQVGVTFSEAVSLKAGAVNVLLSSGLAVPNTAISITNPSGDQKTYVLGFSGSAVIGGSLADGIYDLAITASGVQDAVGNTMTANYTGRFHRLFGDGNGDKRVNLIDYRTLRVTLGRSSGNALFNSAFDFDNSGSVNTIDLSAFRRRYGAVFAY